MTLEDKKKIWWFLMEVDESTIYNTTGYIKIIQKEVDDKILLEWNKEWVDFNNF